MNLDFSDHQPTTNQSYDYTGGHIEFIHRETERMRQTYPGAVFPTICDGPVGSWNCPSTTVPHLLAPKGEGVDSIEEQFHIHLPADFKEFYRLHKRH